MSVSSRIAISEKALRHNLRFLKKRIGKHCQISSVVKGNAYGHGIETYVPLAERCGVKHFSVFSSAEARRVHACSNGASEILIMGDIAAEDTDWVVAEEVSFFVFDLRRIEIAQRAARRVGKPARLHLEVETGLNRTGLSMRSLASVLQRIDKDRERLRLEGVCTHLAGAETTANEYRIREQLERFDSAVERVELAGHGDFLRHTACSAAALVHQESRMDLARFGIAQYGYWPSEETRFRALGRTARPGKELWRLLKWSSRILSIKKVKAGEFVGYGHHFQAQRPMQVAIIPVGYADGFPRELSNRGRVLIRGVPCAVIGAVNMSMTLADVTDLPRVEVDDEVVLIGEQGEHEISVGAFGEMVQSLNYEVLLRLSDSIPRQVVD